MHPDLVLLNYPLDRTQLLADAAAARANAAGYTDPRLNGYVFNDWVMAKHTSPYIESIIKDFEVVGSPRFYWQEPHAVVPFHVDNGTQCSINFVLSDDPAPVSFADAECVYQQALLNTSVLHGVTNGNTQRILLKISIFNETFEQVRDRIKYKLHP